MTDEQQSGPIDQAPAAEEAPQYGVGPFSIREVALVGTWIVAFVVSFFPITGELGRGPSVWTSGIDWVLTIGVPTVAVFLIVLRRLSPQGIRRVGSLGIDQFASVAFSVATVLWLALLWKSFVVLADLRVFPATWVVWVEFFLMLAGVLLTVFAPFIAPFAQDFRGRPEVAAHRNARPVRPVSPRPAPVRPEPAPAEADYAPPADSALYGAPAPYAAGAPYTEGVYDAAPTASYGAAAPAADEQGFDGPRSDDSVTTVIPVDRADADAVAADEIVAADPEFAARDAAAERDAAAAAAVEEPRATEPAHARESFEHVENPSSTVEPAAATAPQHQAFWALVPEERDVVDEIGIPVFRIGPTAWALVIEDRGDAFVVRHEDGRIGYLHDVSGVTRG
ncbi:hypothetical protein [Microbacterium hibisci]|uniref:hypothetical protein n=1 Tax=Microbacterium hibisci TaxID=2036000 RepID=UPI001EF2B242|nr:hypothetical protein [Microbacterium hibisci]